MLKNKKAGFNTLTALALMAILMPMLLFLVVDMPNYLEVNRKLKSIVDNMAASAATIIDEEMLAKGAVVIEADDAETYILEDLAIWFNLDPIIYDTSVAGAQLMYITEGEDSLFDTDPVIIKVSADTSPITDEAIVNASKVEYFIHETNGSATYTFISGQSVTVSVPTIGIKITTVANGQLFNLPMNLVKLGMTEVVFDTQQ